MRVIRFADANGAVRWGQPQGEDYSKARVLSGSPLSGGQPQGPEVPVAKLLAPVEPPTIFCIGANYAEHAREFGHEPPPRPVVFMKPITTLNDPHGVIRIPRCARPEGETDFEGELAVVIGRQARDVSEADALSYVLGYTVANDVSARWWQRNGGGNQFIRGKGFDTFCPLGPVLVTADEIGDPQTMRLTTRLNGQVMQDAHTRDMVFTVRQLIAFLSQDTTLLPGTVILTGTASGVGAARKPPVWMKPGDVVEVEFDRIGVLRNTVG
jgi:2-keto-4-pentenoate hydratase/2-oxohepta-3-ene-1,7-dioic acid hydratase in catechol pathway